MVRAFDDDDIIHIEGDVDPIRDMAIISNELVMKDLMMLNDKLEDLKKKLERFNDHEMKKEVEMLEKAKEVLDKGQWIGL